MALTTIHMDDRRNITPKMTQALQKNKQTNKTLRNNWEHSTLLAYAMTVSMTQPEAQEPNHNLPHFHCDHHSLRIDTPSPREHSSEFYH